jgi:UDP-N-acetylglucosamine diphosphorylase / glucose-1-phosphate thymidylyltransferase / UDP-N-acetylgalactosamine diphosphorylase / glucosamine-1-phosphate N-acetyltransferase / galactosamine-1-phosphate N-acetyltransferase
VRVCVYEDAGITRLHPLSLTRPAFDLRCGAATLLDRQLRCFTAEKAAFVRPELAGLTRLAHPGLPVNEPGWPGGSDGLVLLVNARWLPPAFVHQPPAPEVGLVGEQVAYAAVPAAEARDLTGQTLVWQVGSWKRALPRRPAGGAMIEHPWDLVGHNASALEQDHRHWLTHREGAPVPAGAHLVGPAERYVADPTARVEPLVLVDTTRGPVLVDRGAVVQAFSRLEGPCYVGPHTQVLAARVRGSSLGEQCRVGGEVEASIIHGFSNKAHDGFLGHSYVGEWVNLGAGTQTSDLRNDYAPVTMWCGGHKVETGLLKVGSFIGDHTKTSLDTLFNTGSVAGPFGQLVGSGSLLPRALPSFCRYQHGRVQERTDLREMFATAAAVMARRGREWTAGHADFFLELYERTAGERRQALRDAEQRLLRRVV